MRAEDGRSAGGRRDAGQGAAAGRDRQNMGLCTPTLGTYRVVEISSYERTFFSFLSTASYSLACSGHARADVLLSGSCRGRLSRTQRRL
jgi:hypothetical protein